MPASQSTSQPFDVSLLFLNDSLGWTECWQAVVDAEDPPAAIAKFMRRKMVAERLASELPFRVRVADLP